MPLDQNMYPLPSEKTLRDEFAMAALTGLVGQAMADPDDLVRPDSVASIAYIYADAMLAARKG